MGIKTRTKIDPNQPVNTPSIYILIKFEIIMSFNLHAHLRDTYMFVLLSFILYFMSHMFYLRGSCVKKQYNKIGVSRHFGPCLYTHFVN